ncbi:phenoloxidase-activating factor 2-like [Sabethes cyaneus]|uniref:phenoloxidase-activating factor 2-like n=1 Tax=Sabethes cyaneus TaxID=53552 RepID=UPI00237D3E5F|nr:phenoloxidase-activating factor 2-like [Sabethes cyaneus]
METQLVQLFVLVQVICLLGPVHGQLDGSFWWMNANLIKKAEEYREEKDVKAIVVNNETEFDSIRLQDNTFTDETDDSPDCICVPSKRCKSTASGKQGRDALCGSGNTCCRRNAIIQQSHLFEHVLPPSPTQPTIRTTARPLPATPLRPPADLQPAFSSEPLADPSLLLEITALLDKFNNPNGNDQLELEAEFIFDITPSKIPTTPTTTTTTTRTTTTTTTVKPPPPKTGKKCGQRRAALSSRIHFLDDSESIEQRLSGPVGFAEFPWTVYVEERLANGSFLYKCGGALISPGAVVTAGHCVANGRNTPQQFRIVAGDWDRRHRREKLTDQQRTVQRIVLHPDYYSGSLFNDIAILLVADRFNDSLANVASVCLPSPDEEDSFDGGRSCILTGWGASPASPDREESIQQFVSLSPLATEQCTTRLKTSVLGRRFQMHESFLCAGGVRGVDSCKGSGGSPLVCERNGAYSLVGLMSWGVSCGQGVPSVFAGVTRQVGWIREVVGW